MEEPVPYCRFIDRERRSETVQTPIGLLTVSASGNRMTAKLCLSEELAELDEDACRARAGKLLEDCPAHMAEHIRTMFTDAQLMGEQLARRAEYFGRLSEETARFPAEKRDTEKFNELLVLQLNTLKFLSSAIPVIDAGHLAYTSLADDNPLPYALFEAIIIQVFRQQKTCHSGTR